MVGVGQRERIKSLKSDLTWGYIQGRLHPKNQGRLRLVWGMKTRNV